MPIGKPGRAKFSIPPVVKRNTVLLALSQAFVGAGTQMMPALGALAVLQLTGSALLTGLGTALVGASRVAVAYPAGKMADKIGRRPVLFLALLTGAAGAFVTGLSIVWGSFAMLILGFVLVGLGMAGAQQIRVAAADMYPPEQRGMGMGYVLTGALAGVALSPAIVASAQRLSPAVGIDPLGLPWLFVPLIIVPALFSVFAVRPDPQAIALDLEKHYPGYVAAAQTVPASPAGGTSVSLWRHYPRLSAMVCSFAVQGNMSMMMFLNSLALHEHGYQLAAISVSVSIHVIGMFGFSVPLGWLADRAGRKAVLLAGLVIAGTGSILVPAGSSYWVVTMGTFFVGLGWSAVYVASTVLIADTSAPEERGRAVGVNETFSFIPGIILPLVAGPIAVALGMRAVGVLGVLLMVPPLLFLMWLREPRPGTYVWGKARRGESIIET